MNKKECVLMFPKKWRYRDLEFLLKEAVAKLDGGEFRFTTSRPPIGCIFNRTFGRMHTEESDRGMLQGNEQIEAQYMEEIDFLTNQMNELEICHSKSDKRSSAAAEKVSRILARRANAMNLWELYGIRWRWHGDSVYLIHPPEDVGGSPIVVKYRREDFNMKMANTLSEVISENEKLLLRYQIASSALLIAVLLWVLF